MILACDLCGDPHHAMACPLARATLIEALVEPWPTPPRERRAYRDETVALPDVIPVHAAVVKIGQSLWPTRRLRAVPDPAETVDDVRAVG